MSCAAGTGVGVEQVYECVGGATDGVNLAAMAVPTRGHDCGGRRLHGPAGPGSGHAPAQGDRPAYVQQLLYGAER